MSGYLAEHYAYWRRNFDLHALARIRVCSVGYLANGDLRGASYGEFRDVIAVSRQRGADQGLGSPSFED